MTEQKPYVGQPRPRVEDPAFLRGEAKFTADIVRPGEAAAAVVRSPYAHAEIRSIRTAAALDVPGVLTVYTATDLRAVGVGDLPSNSVSSPLPPGNSDAPVAEAPQYPLAEGRVRFVGEPVAFVVAETAAAARDGAERVDVDYAPLDAVTTADDAMAPGAPQLWPDLPDNRSFIWDQGDVAATEAAFAEAAHVVELDLDFPRETIAFAEPRGVIAEFANGRFTLHIGCQSGHALKPLLASIVGVDAQAVRVIVPETGGGFGARNVAYPEYVLAMVAARALDRPVKWIAERSEAFLTDTQARSQALTARMALDGEGMVTAVDVHARWWHGGYLVNRSPLIIVQWMSPMICGPYRIPAHHFTLEGIFTNTAPIAAFRGIARAEATLCLERLMDRAARRAGIDRVELRRRNLIPRAEMPWTAPTGAVYQEQDFAGSLNAGLQAIDWAGFSGRRTESESRGLRRGRAVTTYIENAGGALTEFADIAVAGNGRVTALVGSQDFGMGHATVFGQVMADVLGVDPDVFDVIDGDTDLVKEGYGAHGSRVMRIGGGAVHNGALKVIDQGREIAGDLLEAAVDDLDYADGAYRVTGTDRTVTLFAVAAEAETRGAPLRVEERFEVPGMSYPSGCHLCEVEVDPETGRIRLDRYVVVSDPGRVVNPLLAMGQLHGGIAMGVGQALLEATVYDADGQLLSGSMMDYCLPRADDMAGITALFNPVDGDDNPLGVKGIGEGPTTASPPTVINAVLDALSEDGVVHLDMPLTPEKVWRAIRGR
jgi:carbon-monoxide dehydrogenase large subunit